ncbi:MAG TPA: hypothetical protein VGR11_15425 [Solirubrobacteraceae bacterium]|nr:hypothetical protein [Solirubrobacteraceae bacterium]
MGASSTRGAMAFLALVLAVVVLVILAITFRGLWFVALPLALIALVLAVRSGAGAPRGASLVVGYLALLLALVALTGSLLAAAADLSIDRGYDVYEGSELSDQPAPR